MPINEELKAALEQISSARVSACVPYPGREGLVLQKVGHRYHVRVDTAVVDSVQDLRDRGASQNAT